MEQLKDTAPFPIPVAPIQVTEITVASFDPLFCFFVLFFPDRCCLCSKYLKKQCKSALEKGHTGEPEVRHLALWESLLA